MADNLLQLFWGLSSENEEERHVSANTMLKTLSELQAKRPSYNECNELQYCTERLVKGLASNRKGVRHGYFITLVEVLKEFSVPFPDLFALIKESLEKVGNAKAQEERGIYFGRLFAYLAVIESGKLNNVDNVHVKRLAKSMMSVYNKKSFLQEFSAESVCRLINAINCDQIFNYVLPHLELNCGWEKCSPGKLYILLKLLERCQDDDRLHEFLSMHWNDAELISIETLDHVSDVLLVSSQSHPQIHVVWPVIINKLRGGPLWRKFWTLAVNNSLMTSTHERKYLCYRLIEEHVLPSLTIEEVDVVLCQRLLQQLENNSSTKHHLLHDAAKHFLEEFPTKISSSSLPGVSLAVAMHLIRYESVLNVFSDLIRRLLQNVSVEDVTKYLDYLINYLWAESSSDEKHAWMNREISMLFKFLGTSLKRERSWLITLARFLILQSHFKSLKQSSTLFVPNVTDPVSASDRTRYTEKLNRTLLFLSDLKCIRDVGKSSGEKHDVPNDFWPVLLVLHIEELIQENEFVNFISEINHELWDKGMDVVKELYSKDNCSRDSIDSGFLYLTSVFLIDLLKNKEKACENLEETLACYQRRITSMRKTPKRRKSIAPTNNSSADWLPVLMDLVLGLLSVPDQYWRNVSERVFLWVKGSLTAEAIEVIVKAIQPQNIDEIMEREDNVPSVDDDDGNSDEEDSEDDNGGDSEDGDGEDSEDGDGVSGHVFSDVGAEFRADIRNALGDLAAVDSDQESVTSLDPEDMEIVDSALSGVFLKQKEKLLEKKQTKTDKTALMHFKMRVLELVELYIRHQSSNPLVMEFLEPLLSLVFKYNSHKTFAPLSERSRNLLDRLCRVKSYPREGVDTDAVHNILQQLITKRLYSAQRLSPVVTQCSMFLIRVLKGTHKCPTISPIATRSSRKKRQIEKENAESLSSDFGVLNVKDVVEWCSTALVDMISDKNCNVQVGFFVTLSERQPEIAFKLLQSLVESLKKSGNHFRKTQGCTVLKAMLGNSKKLSDESAVMLLNPVIMKIINILSQDLLQLSASETKLSHYMPIVEAFNDTVLTALCYDQILELIDKHIVSEVYKHLSSFNDRKLTNVLSSLENFINTDVHETEQLRSRSKRSKKGDI